MKFYIHFFICGILTGFLFPPFFLAPIGFLVFPYLFYLLTNKYLSFGYLKHFSFGFIYGLGFFSIFLFWIQEPFLLVNGAKKFYFLSFLLIIYCSVYFGLIFLFLKFFKNKIFKLFLMPSIIVAAEFICSNLSYGFPWFSFSLIHSPNIIGSSSIYYVGTYGLSYLTIFIFLFPSVLLFGKSKFNILMFYSIVFILIFLSTIYRSSLSNEYISNNLKVSLVQMNYKSNENLNYGELKLKENKIIEIINSDLNDIIIFAENDYPFLINEDKINFIKNKIPKNKTVIIGSTSKYFNEYYNSFYIFDRDNYQKFDKKILVPFGEFIPLRSILGFMDFITGSIDFSKGSRERVLTLNKKIKILPVICYEIIYFWKLIDKINVNSNIIVNLTNDSWFGNFSGPYQHFYFSKLRAAEFNKPLIRISNNGISAYINNYGKIVDFIDLNTSEIREINLLIPDDNFNHLFKHKIFLIFIFIFILVGIIFNKKNEY